MRRWHVKNTNLAERHLLAHEVYVDLNMLGTAMLDWITGHVGSTDIVAEDNGSRTQRAMKLMEKLTEPTTLTHSMSYNTILSLSTRARDHGLTLRRPRYQVITEINTISRSRASSVRTACPVSVRICCERQTRRSMELKTKIQRALDIAENALDKVKMWFPRSMHIQTGLLNSMSNIWTRTDRPAEQHEQYPDASESSTEGHQRNCDTL
jgi:hypothetical protein